MKNISVTSFSFKCNCIFTAHSEMVCDIGLLLYKLPLSRALWQDVLIAVYCHNVIAKLRDGFDRCNFFLEAYDNKNNLCVM